MKATNNYIRFDWAIKRLLRNKANFGVLEGFLSTLMDDQISISSLIESEGNQESADDKYNRVDLMATNQKGEIIIIEVQTTGGIDYFSRMLYASSKAITDHMQLGMDYKMVKKVYSVNVLYFTFGAQDDYVYHGTTEFRGLHTQTLMKINDDDRKGYGLKEGDGIFPEYYLLCVNNFNNVSLTPLDEWITYLKDNTISATAAAPGLAEARRLLAIDQMTTQELLNYESYLKNRASLYSLEEAMERGLRKGEAKGLAKGLAEGLAKGKAAEQRQIATRFKEQGVPAETIAQCTGLSVDEIRRL